MNKKCIKFYVIITLIFPIYLLSKQKPVDLILPQQVVFLAGNNQILFF